VSILDGTEAATARALAIDLAREVSTAGNDYSLVGGSTGFALLCHELSADAPRDAAATLEPALDAIAGGELQDPAFFSGFCGVIWAAARILGDVDTSDIDEVLLTLLSRKVWRESYDLVLGLAGLGVYALDSPQRAPIVSRVIDLLESRAVVTDEGLTWFTPPALLHPLARASAPQGVFDLGMAHGVSGVIALLARAALAGVERERSRGILERAVPWLLAQRLPENALSHFPDRIVAGKMPSPSRLAWCYGDLAVAAALYTAGVACRETAWIDTAERVTRDAAVRPHEQSGVVDAPFCHGAAGVAHLFLRFHAATGDSIFADASRRWLRQLIAMRDSESFLTLRLDEAGNAQRQSVDGMLEGRCGIALALLAATNDAPPSWDRMFLVDLPTGGRS